MWSLAAIGLLLAMLVAALAIGLLVQYEYHRLRTLAANASKVGADQAQALFNGVRFRVRAAQRELRLRAEPQHWLGDPDGLQELLDEIARVNSERGFTALWAVDQSGRLMAMSARPAARGADLSDLPYFEALLNGADGLLGEPLNNRAVGGPVVPYFEWVRDAAGMPVFILAASIDLSLLEHLYRGIMANDLTVSGLRRDDGVLVAGAWPPEVPLPSEALAASAGWILAQTPVRTWPLVAVAGVPTREAWESIRLPSAMVVGIVLLLGAIIFLLKEGWEQHRRTHATLARVEEQQRLMLRELNHRIKNIVAIIQAVAQQTQRHSADWAEFEPAFMGRLGALARTSTLLGVQAWQATELRPLIEAALEPYHAGETGIVLHGPDALLSPRMALTLSLALHELATNAAKYGALSVADGRVAVTWDIAPAAEGRRLVLTWAERGGPTVRQPARRGLGRELIEYSVAYELNGMARLEFPPGGVRCRIEAPLPPAPEYIASEPSP